MRSVDYKKILRRSWELTKTNKWLWVFGLVLAVFGGSSGGSGGSSGSSASSNLPKAVPKQVSPQLQEKAAKVLGATTGILKEWAASIPIGTWILIGLLVFLLILFFGIISWIMRNWARASLIAAMDAADQGQAVNLKTASPKGIAKIKHFIILDLITFGIIIGIVIALGLLFGLGILIFSFSPTLRIIWGVLIGILAAIFFIIAVALIALMTVYADRFIVFYDLDPWPAWQKGLKFAKHEFLPTLVMGIINYGISCAAGCVSLIAFVIVLGIPALFIALPSFSHGFRFPNIGQIIGLGLLLIVFIAANILVRTILVVFNYGNWNLFFRDIVKEGSE